jgi:signal transduction histidine kinase
LLVPALIVDASGIIRFVNRAATDLISNASSWDGAVLSLGSGASPTADSEEVWRSVHSAPGRQLSSVSVRIQFKNGKSLQSVASLALLPDSGTIQCILMPGAHELYSAVAFIALTLTSGRGLDYMLQQVAHRTRDLCRADRVYFELCDASGRDGLLRALSSSSTDESLQPAGAKPLSELAKHVRGARRTFRSGNLQVDARALAPLFADTISLAAVPLLYTEQKGQAGGEEEFLGVMVVEGRIENQFSSNTQLILDMLAKHATLAIAHGRLLREMREDSANILEQIRGVQDSLGASKLLHEGKNVLRQAHYELQAIEQDIGTYGGKRVRAWIRGAIDKLDDQSIILADLLDSLKRPRDEREEVDQVVDLQRIVNRVINIVAVPEDLVEMKFEPVAPAHIRASDRAMTFMIFNLIQNAIAAIKRGQRKGVVQIALAPAAGRSGFCRLTLEDSGVGMEREFLELVRAEERVSKFRGGSGIGLVTIRDTVRKAGGSISVDSTLGKGTRFTIDLPLAG